MDVGSHQAEPRQGEGSARGRSRPVWQWVVIVGLAGSSLGLSGWTVYRMLTDTAPTRPGPRGETLSYREMSRDGGPARGSTREEGAGSALRSLLSGRAPAEGAGALDGLLSAAGPRQPLNRNPGGLSPPAGATRQGRFVQRGGGLVEEVGQWWAVDRPLAGVARHYREQAKAAGWTPIAGARAEVSSGGSKRRRLSFTGGRGPKEGRVLSVHLRKWSGGVHVTVRLRYAMGSTAGDGP